MQTKNAIIILTIFSLLVLGFLGYLYFSRPKSETVSPAIKKENSQNEASSTSKKIEEAKPKIEDLKKEEVEQRKVEIISNLEEKAQASIEEDPEVKEERINDMRKLLKQ